MSAPPPIPMRRPSRETIGERRRTHGHTVQNGSSPTYTSWCNMLARCHNPRASSYKYYGAKGIAVCERWLKFEEFLADMGERPSSKHSLDRWPNRNGNYEPGNCRWATQSEQCRNKTTTRPVVRSDGVRFPSIIDAAEATGGNRRCIRDACIGRQKTHNGFSWRYDQ